MKIDNSFKSVGSIAGEGVTGKSGKTDSARPEPGVSVELSGLSSQLQALDAQVSSGEVVDAARVAEIKQAISEGRFKVNPDVVADRLLQTVRDLIVAYKR
ncbi:MAG: flagellar biosynthesis anti-sigma factor FlgM [Betaproteobacteria bacterium]|nr:flagellar biosynthesis anti-sigma factor FlgM [Betaproteobacteria bacterium]